jgi:hypothetical protein
LCLEEKSTYPDNAAPEGVLVLDWGATSHFLFDLKTRLQAPLIRGTREIFGLEISPDRKKMIYLDCGSSASESGCVEIIASVDGLITTIPYRSEWRIIRWLDNEHLIINHDLEPPDSDIVLNPFSGEEVEIPLNLPDPYYALTPMDTSVLLNYLDSSMTRVVYLDTQGIGRLVLWDIVEEKILTWLPYPVPNDPAVPPPNLDLPDSWSPDGSQFVTTSPVGNSVGVDGEPVSEELFSISKNGDKRQLTYLSNEFNMVRITGYRWSPDGLYLTFWAKWAESANQSMDDLDHHFIVLDSVTLEATDYCLSSVSNISSVWAPNSQQLAVNMLSDDRIWRVILVDLRNNFSTPITEDLTVDGWMLSP